MPKFSRSDSQKKQKSFRINKIFHILYQTLVKLKYFPYLYNLSTVVNDYERKNYLNPLIAILGDAVLLCPRIHAG